MAWTKKEYISQAFEEIGLAGYIYDLEPEQLESALRRLDSMMAGWNANGIRVGWPMSTGNNSESIDMPAPVPDAAIEAIYTNLAIRIAPAFGKTVSADLKQIAHFAYLNMSKILDSKLPERKIYQSLPRGAGYKGGGRPFIGTPEPSIDAGPDNSIELE